MNNDDGNGWAEYAAQVWYDVIDVYCSVDVPTAVKRLKRKFQGKKPK